LILLIETCDLRVTGITTFQRDYIRWPRLGKRDLASAAPILQCLVRRRVPPASIKGRLQAEFNNWIHAIGAKSSRPQAFRGQVGRRDGYRTQLRKRVDWVIHFDLMLAEVESDDPTGVALKGDVGE